MLAKVFKINPIIKSLTNRISLKYFSGGHGHEDLESKENNYHPRKYDRISYNKKLTNLEREK
jgi:hypothetical protein